jgi:DNA polymerase III subunit beta
MKIVCSQSDLKHNLSLTSRAVPSSRPEPVVLGNILLEANETTQKVKITAFDGSLGIQTSFNAEVIEAGSITLPAKYFNDIVAKLPEMEITLAAPTSEDSEASAETNLIATLSSESGTFFQLAGIDAAEFPELPAIEKGEVLTLPIAALNQGLAGCLFAASTDISKQILTGVHVKGDRTRGVLEFAATDSHRLAVVETSILEDTESTSELEIPDFALTIPARALRELERIVNDANTEVVEVHFDDTQLIFELGNRRLTSLRIAGAYPAYGQLIPQKFSRSMIVDRKRLLASLELVAVLAQKNNIIKFTLDSDGGELILSADAKDIGSAKQSLPAEITGDNIDIAFNIRYLMDGLKALAATEIKMQLNEWNQPVIFTPLGSLKITYLIMPVQIRN